MPKIDRNEYMSTEAKLGGGSSFEQMEPGVYELYIQAIRTEWDTRNGHTDGNQKQCVRVIWDVASGQFEKKFTDAYFIEWDGTPNAQKDFMHSCFLSWKKMPYLKSKFAALDAANPGFDSFAAFSAIPDVSTPDDWKIFVGKRFWAVVDGEVSLNDNGYDRWTLNVNAWITPEQAKSGQHPEPIVTDNRMKPKNTAAPSAYGSTLNV